MIRAIAVSIPLILALVAVLVARDRREGVLQEAESFAVLARIYPHLYGPGAAHEFTFRTAARPAPLPRPAPLVRAVNVSPVVMR